MVCCTHPIGQRPVQQRPRLPRTVSADRLCAVDDCSLLQEPGSTVLVAGSTGGVGQLLTAKLLDVSRRPQGPSKSCSSLGRQPASSPALPSRTRAL